MQEMPAMLELIQIDFDTEIQVHLCLSLTSQYFPWVHAMVISVQLHRAKFRARGAAGLTRLLTGYMPVMKTA